MKYSLMEPVKNEKGCWYMTYIEECPACGRGDEYRERRPAPAPEHKSEQYQFIQRYDWCLE